MASIWSRADAERAQARANWSSISLAASVSTITRTGASVRTVNASGSVDPSTTRDRGHVRRPMTVRANHDVGSGSVGPPGKVHGLV